MNKQVMKNILSYVLVLLAGLAVGYAAVNVPRWLKPSYTEGNFNAHYQANGPQVVVYGTETCPYCAKTRDLLNSKHIAFSDRNVNSDPAAQKNFAEFGTKAVPVILIGKRRIDGFNQKAIEEALQQLPAKPAA